MEGDIPSFRVGSSEQASGSKLKESLDSLKKDKQS